MAVSTPTGETHGSRSSNDRGARAPEVGPTQKRGAADVVVLVRQGACTARNHPHVCMLNAAHTLFNPRDACMRIDGVVRRHDVRGGWFVGGGPPQGQRGS